MQITVIGAGVFGAWCAWSLAERQHRVTLIDAYGPANARASSADHSRVIRCGYGADAIYSQWAREALDDWHALSRLTSHELVTISGALFMGAPDDAYIRATSETLGTIGIPAEPLAPADLSARYPQIAASGLGTTVFEPEAGVIRARAAVQALVSLMRSGDRVEYRVARVAPFDESCATARIHLTTGEEIGADAVVCACGPWLPALLPIAVGGRIRPTRQEVLHFGVPSGDDRFSLARLPVWIDFDAGLYGIPDLDARGFKVGIDRHGPTIDPDSADRIVDRERVERTRAWLAYRFPALADAPLLDAHVCQYENTTTGDFIIDRHPQWPHVWIVGGGSGHGFKHGPAVGRHLAALIDRATPVNPRFALARKSDAAARSVY